MASHRLLSGLVAWVSGAGRQTGQQLLNLLSPRRGIRLSTDLQYGPAQRHRLDIYSPRNVDTQTPIVVFLYGGRWQQGTRDGYRFVGRSLARRGFIAVIPDYRLYPEVCFPAFVEDAALALRWVSRELLDTAVGRRPLFISGHSAGAHIAALMALDERYLEAHQLSPAMLTGVVGISGPYDFLPLRDQDLREMFGPEARHPESQPMHWVRSGAPPFLLLHGDADHTVRPGNARRLAEALRSSGVSVQTRYYPAQGHLRPLAGLARPLRWLSPTLQDLGAFIDGLGRTRAQ